ncbi:MAG: U32 family peptidase [Spirochaetes bacterium]|nr:MAG: U32 family peptidase [Spirochaetota bacterium]
MHNFPLLVSPAGNLEKLKAAVRYGAHEVYFGGEGFNLRSQAGNIGQAEMEEACSFAHAHGARTVFLLNSFLHESDIPAAREYLRAVAAFPFDALMVSDPGMLMLVRDEGVSAPIHLSTQMSTLNHLAIKFWTGLGVTRIVLAREVTLEEVKRIREHTDAELEMFVHGALCVSYSGRCLLSRYMTGRDANRGSCAHPCRWRYTLTEESRPGEEFEIVEHERGTEILSSKDLCLIETLPDYVRAGVSAFKIEGRMKSLYYAANVTRVYRHALDTIAAGGDYAARLPFWRRELDLVSHRPYTADLFNEFGKGGFDGVPYVNNAVFMAAWEGAGADTHTARMKAFNPVYAGDVLDAIYPVQDDRVHDGPLVVTEIHDGEKSVAMAEPAGVYRFSFNGPVREGCILRKRAAAYQGDSHAR